MQLSETLSPISLAALHHHHHHCFSLLPLSIPIYRFLSSPRMISIQLLVMAVHIPAWNCRGQANATRRRHRWKASTTSFGRPTLGLENHIGNGGWNQGDHRDIYGGSVATFVGRSSVDSVQGLWLDMETRGPIAMVKADMTSHDGQTAANALLQLSSLGGKETLGPTASDCRVPTWFGPISYYGLDTYIVPHIFSGLGSWAF